MSDPAPPVARAALGVLCAAQLALLAVSSGPAAYGYMSDEMYYLDCAERLAWGYVDHPPLSLALLAAVRALLGTSLLALHLLPALALCVDFVLVALLARELGGGRTAQALAAIAVFAAPVHQGIASFYSMNAFEPVFWSGAFVLLARLGRGGRPHLWLLLGVVLGLGLLNKLSVLWCGAGIALGLVVTPERRWLATPWPWACAGIAFLFLAPHLVWQVEQGWPTLEFMRNATAQKMVAKTPVAFARDQLLVMGPLAAPFWLAGLAWLLAAPEARSQRLLAWIWIGVIGLLVASGSVRSNYAAPAYAPLFAAGGVALERFAHAQARRALPALAAALLLVSALAILPLGVPLLPPERLVAWMRVLGIEPPRDQIGETGPLPLHFGLRFGWAELVDAVDAAQAGLAPGERERAVVLVPSFGAAGALHFLGRGRALPPVISGHNNYFLWGHGGAQGEVLIAVAEDPGELERTYRSVDRVAEIDCSYCDAETDRWAVFVCRGLRAPFEEVWARARHFI